MTTISAAVQLSQDEQSEEVEFPVTSELLASRLSERFEEKRSHGRTFSMALKGPEPESFVFRGEKRGTDSCAEACTFSLSALPSAAKCR